MSDRWIEMNPQDGVGRANFTDLAPGSYVLEVYSAGFDKVWSEAHLSSVLHRHPDMGIPLEDGAEPQAYGG